MSLCSAVPIVVVLLEDINAPGVQLNAEIIGPELRAAAWGCIWGEKEEPRKSFPLSISPRLEKRRKKSSSCSWLGWLKLFASFLPLLYARRCYSVPSLLLLLLPSSPTEPKPHGQRKPWNRGAHTLNGSAGAAVYIS